MEASNKRKCYIAKRLDGRSVLNPKQGSTTLYSEEEIGDKAQDLAEYGHPVGIFQLVDIKFKQRGY